MPIDELGNSTEYQVFSLEKYTTVAVEDFSRVLEKHNSKVIFTMVFGSAITPREKSESIKIDPLRWDVDVLWIIDSREEIAAVTQLTTESGKVYVPVSQSKLEWQEKSALGVKPKHGLHIFILSLSELLESTDDLVYFAIRQGSVLSGSIPNEVKSKFGEISLAKPIWQNLRHSYLGKNKTLI